MRNTIQAAQLNVPAVRVGVKRPGDVAERAGNGSGNGKARWAAHTRAPPTGR
ncbi:hypothetical protein TUSST3_07370 [Streptomyces sp. TUS-ST3]|nr:hypothetical protein TUSST3_07370 [Streptomyces sp. TUS-ST3]